MSETICVFTGQPRQIKDSHTLIDQFVLKPNNITKVFAHFWIPETNRPFKAGTLKALESTAIEQFISLYKPTGLTVEKQKFFELKGWTRGVHTDNGHYDRYAEFANRSLAFSRERCSTLIESEINASTNILLLRSDFMPRSEWILPECHDKVFVRSNTHFPFGDHWFFGRSDLMYKMMSHGYNCLDQVYNKLQNGVQELIVAGILEHLSLNYQTLDVTHDVQRNHGYPGHSEKAYTE